MVAADRGAALKMPLLFPRRCDSERCSPHLQESLRNNLSRNWLITAFIWLLSRRCIASGVAWGSKPLIAPRCGRMRPEQPLSTRRSAPIKYGAGTLLTCQRSFGGRFLYLYLVMDVWSRRITGWEVHERESAEDAADMVERICRESGIDPKGLVLHSDNGKPMRGSTMVATLQWLGIVPSFSRPHVCNDNPYSEALFRTLKHTPAYPRLPFASTASARDWVTHFVAWYNSAHHHSAIRYVSPDDRHFGREKSILAQRAAVYERARRRNPERWSGETRDWTPVETVVLNPNPDVVVAA